AGAVVHGPPYPPAGAGVLRAARLAELRRAFLQLGAPGIDHGHGALPALSGEIPAQRRLGAPHRAARARRGRGLRPHVARGGTAAARSAAARRRQGELMSVELAGYLVI